MDLFFKLFDITENIGNVKVSRFLSLIIRTLANLYAPLYFRLSKRKGKKHDLDKQLIVSFTSFPRRIGKVWIVVESMLHQTLLPDKIILYLSKDQFTQGLESLPKNIVSLVGKIFEIRFVDRDIRSYKKFYYAFKEFSDSYIITIDDDVIYPKDTISSLCQAHKKHKDCVIARYAHRMTYNSQGEVLMYSRWININANDNPSYNNFFAGAGGVFYDIESIDNAIFNENIFLKICKLGDDIWLNAFTRLAHQKTFVVNGESAHILNVQIPHDQRLFSSNIGKSQNDIQIENVNLFFKEKYGVVPFNKKYK